MKQHSEGFLRIVQEARLHIRETDVATVFSRMQNGEDLTIVDVREESEFVAGHIPGAVHLSKGIIERDIETRFPDRDQELILYCGGGYRSALAAQNLQRMGYSSVISMDGGMRVWRDAGHDEVV